MDKQDAEKSPPERDGASRRYFGPRLRELRETYAQRIDSEGPARPLLRATPSASALIQCMQEQSGFSISGAAFNEIENGLNVPRDAVRFINAVAICLRLTEQEKADLSKRLAYDLVSSRLRELTPLAMLPDPEW